MLQAIVEATYDHYEHGEEEDEEEEIIVTKKKKWYRNVPCVLEMVHKGHLDVKHE